MATLDDVIDWYAHAGASNRNLDYRYRWIERTSLSRQDRDDLVAFVKVFRVQCSVCHTLEGMNAVCELAATWSIDQRRLNIAQLQRTKPFMPPFAGTPAEVEAVVQLIGWIRAGKPPAWEETHDATVLEEIGRWLDEAGTGPGDARLAAAGPPR